MSLMTTDAELTPGPAGTVKVTAPKEPLVGVAPAPVAVQRGPPLEPVMVTSKVTVSSSGPGPLSWRVMVAGAVTVITGTGGEMIIGCEVIAELRSSVRMT